MVATTIARTKPPGQTVRVLRRSKRQSGWLILTVVVAFLVLLPIIPLMLQAFETTDVAGEPQSGFQRFFLARDLGEVLLNTFWLGFGALVIALLLGISLALCVFMLPSRIQPTLAFTPVLPIIIPSVAHVSGFVFLFSPENGYVNTLLRMTPFVSDATTSGPIDVYTAPWIIAYTGVNVSSFVYLFVYSGLQGLGQEHGLAARVSGAGSLRVLLTVTLPMLRPTIIYAGVIALLLSLGQFTAPLMLGRRRGIEVITTRIYNASSEYPIDFSLAAAFGAPLLVVAVLLIIVQRMSLGDQKRFVGSGSMGQTRARVGKVASGLGATYVIGFVILTAILPLLSLIYVALSPFWSGAFGIAQLSLTNLTNMATSPQVTEAVVTTLQVTLTSLVIVAFLGLLIATALVNRDKLWRPVGFILDTATQLPLAVPAALVGFGFLFAFSTPGVGLYGSTTSLVIAYVTIMIPYAVRYQLSTLIQLGQQTTEASRASGAGPLQTFFRVILPLARGGLASAAAVMFILLSHEFGVSLLLRGQDNTVLAVLLFDQYSSGSYPMVAAIALVMTAVTSLGVIAALIFGGSKALEKM